MDRINPKSPIRTCISCGSKRDKAALNRLVLDADGLLIRDDKGKGQGRGAYVCQDKSCWDKIGNGRMLKRAFRRDDCISLHPDFEFP